MYPVSQDFQDKIKKRGGIFEIKIQIDHSTGTLNLSDKDLSLGILTYTESSQAGEEFTIGSTVASDISFVINNRAEYADIQFMGATVTCSIGLLVKEGIDAHFLQPSQPSKMKGFEEKWEYVPLGRFNIDDVNIQRNTIELKAIDNMIKFDLPYSLSKLSYPATLYQIYVNACNVCDVLPGIINFPNMHYVVKERPQDDLTFRDIIGYVAELSGTFAKCNRNGALELLWYKSTGLTLDPSNRFDFKPSDDEVRIKGIMASTEDTTYLSGSEDYAIDLTENPLLQGGHETVLPNIFNNVKDTVFTPYTSNWQGNPAIQAGDMLTQIDRDGKVYNTLVTKSTFKYRGKSNLEARGLPEISRGYKGDVHKKIAQIKRVVEKEVGDKLTTLEQARLNATELMANMLGGYFIDDKENGAMYVANHPELSKATEYWKWGLGGYAHYVNGELDTAITADGSIVAMLVAANIVTADMIVTGILQSEDGSVSINLDQNTFNFKNQLRWDGVQDKLILGPKTQVSWDSINDSPDILTETQVTTITNDTITTTNVIAQNLKVKSLNIQGEIVADSLRTNASIDVGTDAKIGNNLYLGVQTVGSLKGIYFQNNSRITNNNEKMQIYARQGFDIYADNGNLQIGTRYNSGFTTMITGANISIDARDSTSSGDITISSRSGSLGSISLRNGSTTIMEIENDGVDFKNYTPKNLKVPSVQDKNDSYAGIEFRVVSGKLEFRKTTSGSWTPLQ